METQNNTQQKLHVLVAIIFLVINAGKITFPYFFSDAGYDYLILQSITSIFIVSLFFGAAFKTRSLFFPILFYSLQIIYVLINTLYYEFYANFLPVSCAYNLFFEGLQIEEHNGIPLNWNICLFFIDLPFFIYLLFARKKAFISNRYICLSAALLVFVYSMIVLYKVDMKDALDDQAQFNSRYVVHKYGFVAYDVYDALKNNESEIMKLYGPKIFSTKEKVQKANILILQIESLDANMIDRKHDGKLVMPYLHFLSKNCVYYPYTLVYRGAGGTSDSEVVAINSMQSSKDFAITESQDYMYPNSLPKALGNGYESYAFHGNKGSFYNRLTAFTRMGFDKFFDIFAMRLPEKKWGAADGDVFDFAAERIKDAEKRKASYYYHVISMSSHYPFNIIGSYYHDKDYDDINNKLLRGYMNSMNYVDRVLEKFITDIKKSNPNTYIFVYGDHPPYAIEDYSVYNRSSFKSDDLEFEFVPLFILTPDKKVYEERKKVASLLDIAPTALHASGKPFRIRTSGVDLLDFPMKNKPVPANGIYNSRETLFKQALRTK